MAPQFIFLSLLFGGILSSTKSEDSFEQISFEYQPQKKLNLTRSAKGQSYQVNNKMECFTKCTNVHWCQSGNFKTTSEPNGLHVCELLPSDRFTEKNTLKEDKAYLHFNIKTPCHSKNKPCLNEGRCVFKNSTHQCQCENGYHGEQCEKESSTATSGSPYNFPYVGNYMGWWGADSDCKGKGGKLPSIHSAADNDKVKALYQEAGAWIWLGIRESSGALTWSDGTTVDYTNFRHNSSANGHCGYMEWDGYWGSSSCGNSLKFICVN